MHDGWEREKRDLEARLVNLIKVVEKYKSDPSTSKEGANELKRKVNEYKQKVKLANLTIAKISQKLGMAP